MSTYCIIAFTDGQRTVSTYKHSDGYESHTIPLLAKFLKWNNRDDLEYSLANWFYFAKSEDKKHLEQDKEKYLKATGCTQEQFKENAERYDKVGYGLELENLEADYIVHITEKTINGRGVVN